MRGRAISSGRWWEGGCAPCFRHFGGLKVPKTWSNQGGRNGLLGCRGGGLSTLQSAENAERSPLPTTSPAAQKPSSAPLMTACFRHFQPSKVPKTRSAAPSKAPFPPPPAAQKPSSPPLITPCFRHFQPSKVPKRRTPPPLQPRSLVRPP